MKIARLAYTDYKNTGVQWMGDIPKHWCASKIKEVLIERKEKNFPVKTNYILSLTAKKGVIPYSEKGRGGNKAKEDLSQYHLAYPDDLIVNCMNVVAGSVGLSKYYGAISPVYYALYKRSDFINVNFISHVFQLKSFQRSLVGLGNGILMRETESGNLNTIRMRIPMSKLYRVLLPIPPKEEQDQIVRFLDSKMAKINKFVWNKKRLIELLKEQKQAVINQAVTKGLDPDAKMKPSGVGWLGDVPEGWEVRPLKTIGVAIIGLTYSPGDLTDEKDDKGVLLLRASNIKDGKIRLEDNVYVKTIIPEKLVVKNNDLLICVRSGSRALVGKCALIKDIKQPMSFGVFMTVFRSVHSEFIYHVLNSNIFKVQSGTFSTSTINQLTLRNLNSMIVPFPTKNIRDEIVKYIESQTQTIDTTIGRIQKEIDLITEYRTSLISAVVTGKVDVRGIEVDEPPAEDLAALEPAELEADALQEEELMESEVG